MSERVTQGSEGCTDACSAAAAMGLAEERLGSDFAFVFHRGRASADEPLFVFQLYRAVDGVADPEGLITIAEGECPYGCVDAALAEIGRANQ